MSIFAQAFPVGGGAEAEEEEESSVFGAAPVRMRLNKPAANRFILGAVRHAQAHNKVQFAKQAESAARAKLIAAQPFVGGKPLKPPTFGEEEEEEEQGWCGEEEDEEEAPAPKPKPKAKPARVAVRRGRLSAPAAAAVPPAPHPTPVAPKRIAKRASLAAAAASPVVKPKPKPKKKQQQTVVFMDEEGTEHQFDDSSMTVAVEPPSPAKPATTATTKKKSARAKATAAAKPKPARRRAPPKPFADVQEVLPPADDADDVDRELDVGAGDTMTTTTTTTTKTTTKTKTGRQKQVLVRRSLRILMKENPQVKSRFASLTQPPAMWTEHGRRARAEKREGANKDSRHKKLEALRAAALAPQPVPLTVPGLPTNWVCNLIVPTFLCPPSANGGAPPTLRPPAPGASTLFASLFS